MDRSAMLVESLLRLGLRPDQMSEAVKEAAEKCEPEHYRPFGGATTWSEIDAWDDAWEKQMALDRVSHTFQALIRNIQDDHEMEASAKATAIEAAASEMGTRLREAGEKEAAEEVEDAGLVTRILTGLGFKQQTKTEGGVSYPASDYADVPDAEKPSSWKLRLAEGRPGNVTVAQVARAITAMQPSGFRGQRVQMGQSKATVAGRISAAIGRISGATDEQKANLRERLSAVKELPEGDVGGIRFIKSADGSLRWWGLYTNAYQDSQDEIFPAASHKDYAEWAEKEGRYPELRTWHIPGTRLGSTEMIGFDEDTGFMVAAGTIDKKRERVVKSLKESGVPLGLSHGYNYSRGGLVDGVYVGGYKTFEISVLPRDRAANKLTAFGAQEDLMLTDAKKAFLKEHFGDEEAALIEQTANDLAAKAKAAGLSYKEFEFEAAEGDGAGQEQKTDPDPPPATKEEPQPDVLAAVKEALTPLQASIDQVKSTLTEHTEAIASLQRSDDEKVAEKFGPRRQAPGAVAGKAASQSDNNVADGSKQTVQDAEQQERGDIPAHLERYFAKMGAVESNAGGQ